jgi:hypothetical protein
MPIFKSKPKACNLRYSPLPSKKCKLNDDTAIVIIGTHGEILCEKKGDSTELETFVIKPDVEIWKFNLVQPGDTAITGSFVVNQTNLSSMTCKSPKYFSEYIRNSSMCDFSNLLSVIFSTEFTSDLKKSMTDIVTKFINYYKVAHQYDAEEEKEQINESLKRGVKISSTNQSWFSSFVPSFFKRSSTMINKKYSVSSSDNVPLSLCDYDITYITSKGILQGLPKRTRTSELFITTEQIIDSLNEIGIKKFLMFDLSCAPLRCQEKDISSDDLSRLCSDISSKGMCYGGKKSRKKSKKRRRSKTQKYLK